MHKVKVLLIFYDSIPEKNTKTPACQNPINIQAKCCWISYLFSFDTRRHKNNFSIQIIKCSINCTKRQFNMFGFFFIIKS